MVQEAGKALEIEGLGDKQEDSSFLHDDDDDEFSSQQKKEQARMEQARREKNQQELLERKRREGSHSKENTCRATPSIARISFCRCNSVSSASRPTR